jgi:hypothetical protein
MEGTSYTDIDGTAYKPDIVAQGKDAVSPYGSAGCTSSAAPLEQQPLPSYANIIPLL